MDEGDVCVRVTVHGCRGNVGLARAVKLTSVVACWPIKHELDVAEFWF